MKQFLWIIFALLPFSASADIIVTKSNGNIEDVTVIKLTATEVVYTQADNQLTLAAETVDGVLYDDGRYASPPSQSQPQPQQPSGTTTSSVETPSGSVSSSGRGGLMGALEQFYLEKVQRWEQKRQKRKVKMEEYSRSKNASKEQQASSDTPVEGETAPTPSVSDDSNW